LSLAGIEMHTRAILQHLPREDWQSWQERDCLWWSC
jgi:hypothetical protein